MKKIVLTLVLSLFGAVIFAQELNKKLNFIYIAHDHSTPVDKLCDRLSDLYQTAKYEKDIAVIFYLPNSDEPKVVKMNLPGENPDDFPDILGELIQKSSHEVFPEVDIEKIPSIFNETDFVDAFGNPQFASFNITYYINPTFWMLGYNESIIAKLYFTLELDKLPKSYFKMQIWHSKDDGLIVDEKQPFGTKNLCSGFNFLLLGY